MFGLICVVCGLWKLTPYTNILGIKDQMMYALVFCLKRTGTKLGFYWIVILEVILKDIYFKNFN